MFTYRIVNRHNGSDFGVHYGESGFDAIRRMLSSVPCSEVIAQALEATEVECTDEQIRALLRETDETNDNAMGEICTRALCSGFRVYQGRDTSQVSVLPTTSPAEPDSWYWEPLDYSGDVLWSAAFATREEALAAAEADRAEARTECARVLDDARAMGD